MIAVQPTTNANTPSIISSAGTAIASNANRIAWSIQNLGTNPLFVRLGAGGSPTLFHTVLKGSTGQDDGTGGIASESVGTVYTGIITVDGTNPRFTVLEIAP